MNRVADSTASWNYAGRRLCLACDTHHAPDEYCEVLGFPSRPDRFHVVVRFDADDWRTEQTVGSEEGYARALGLALHYASWDAYERVLIRRMPGTGEHQGPRVTHVKDGHHKRRLS